MALYLPLKAFTYQLHSQKSIHLRVQPLHWPGRPTRFTLITIVVISYVQHFCQIVLHKKNGSYSLSIITCNSMINRISKLWLRTSSLSYPKLLCRNVMYLYYLYSFILSLYCICLQITCMYLWLSTAMKMNWPRLTQLLYSNVML